MKKTATIIALGVALTGGSLGAVSIDTQNRIDNLPDHVKLKAPVERVLESQTFRDEKGLDVVAYKYVGDNVETEPNEIVAMRSNNKRVYRTESPDILKMRVYDESFVEEQGEWKYLEKATTTKEAFDLQTQGLLDRFVDVVSADIETVYTVKDTYYGTVFSAGPNHTATDLNYGGWGDHYYAYIEWDLTGTPTSAETTAVDSCFKAASIATNWADVQIRRVTSSWAESTLTRTNAPTDAGATGQIDQTQPMSVGTYYCTGILSYYENWKDGTWDNYGIKLHDIGSNSDAQGDYYSSNRAGTSDDPYLEITFTPANTAPTVTSNAATSVTDTTATINGEITATGGASVTQHGFAFGTDSTLATAATSTLGAGSVATFNEAKSSLTAETTYYFRAYATNSEGTSYGSILNFTTEATETPATNPSTTNIDGADIIINQGNFRVN